MSMRFGILTSSLVGFSIASVITGTELTEASTYFIAAIVLMTVLELLRPVDFRRCHQSYRVKLQHLAEE